ncbi:hypothetical protein [Nitrosopumilus piranensis]|uniref:Uncharacterized protein n=1 Tax=Nitrosopumilus piranensis TaxID=1582439 RepID=A0A0C5CD21_9ARCH|nr:hypothetical protein [Nitrosopumilus piranensis]AJM93087.1 exported protein of unknown function [Nitrosopumilus piranensis]
MKTRLFTILAIGVLGFSGTAFALEPSYTNYYSNPEFSIYSLVVGDYVHDIPYSISDGTIEKIKINCNSSELVLTVQTTGDSGILTIGLSRYLIDSKFTTGNDDVFFVLENSEEAHFTELTDAGLRILTIPFSKNASTITIIGANYPESTQQNTCNGSDNRPFSYPLLSPLKQFKSGIPINEIQCKESLILVTKYDGFPACVKSDTVSSLSQRQWGMPHEFLVKLVENSDAIITGMVVGEDNRLNGERHVWLGSYEWLKQGKYDDQQLFLEQTATHSGNGFNIPFERGEEVLLFLKNVDVKRGAYDLVDSDMAPAQKHSVKLRDAVATFFDHEFFYQNVNNYDANEDYCSEKFLDDDSYYYCTTKSESHVLVEKLTEKIKEKILEKISPEYFEKHFDLTIVSDEPDVVVEPKPNSGPYTTPAKASGQNIEFVFTIDGLDFNYFMRTTFDKEQNQMYLHYHPPREIKSIVSTEDEIDKLIYSCLEKEMSKFPYKPFHVAYHAEDGLSPVVEGHGPPTVYDRWGDAPVQDREKIFRVWLATGKVDCTDVHQEFIPENKKRPEKILLFDSTQLEKLD